MSARIHVFAVGVETYQKADINPVSFAENDAREFTKAWQALGAKPADCVLLLSPLATKTAIESALRRFIKGVSRGDTIVFFFAGHGFTQDGDSHLVTHDTQPDDLAATSVPLTTILKQLRECPSRKVLLFIATGENGFPVASEAGAITSNFTGDELGEFCEGAEHRLAFTACQADESSWSSSTLKHGLWSQAVIQALSGDAKAALEKSKLVTGHSLQTYLAAEVPRLLRTTRSGPETQTPCCFGNATRELVVADLTGIFQAKAARAPAMGSVLKDSSLRGEVCGPVRKLSGFQKANRIPDSHSSAADAFVRRAGHEEVKAQADAIHETLRAQFGYKRKEISHVCEDGGATIKTPDFEVNLSIAQAADDPAGYVLTTEVGAIRRPEIVADDAFGNAFSSYCNSVLIVFSARLDLADKIDEIEGVAAFKAHLDYKPDCSAFTLNLPAPRLRIHVTAERMTLSSPATRDIKTLLANTQNALAALGGSGVQLLLPAKATA